MAYHRAARMIASGNMYWASEHTWPAGYPLLLAGIYSLTGSYGLLAAKLVNAHFGAVVAALTAFIAGYLFESRAAGWISGLLVGLWPQYVFYSSVLASENACLFFLVLAAFFAVCYQQKEGFVNAACISE